MEKDTKSLNSEKDLLKDSDNIEDQAPVKGLKPIEYYDEYYDQTPVEVLTPDNFPSLYDPDMHHWICVYEDGTRVFRGRSKR
jgi:hypothetical protein